MTEYNINYREPTENIFIKLENQKKEKEELINKSKSKVKLYENKFGDSYDDENLITLLSIYNRQKLKVKLISIQENSSQELCLLERLFI